MPVATQADRLLRFTSPLGSDVLLAESFRGVEGLSQLFELQVELLAAKSTSVDAKAIVGKKVTLDIQVSDDDTLRHWNGIVNSFEFCGGDEEFNVYRAYIVPSLWLLTRTMDTRVFQSKSVTDVIKAVLSKYAVTLEDKTQATYKTMDYCTQYRETDFAFISRLMEQFGIFYYFSHTENDHTFTLQDNSQQLPACDTQSSFRYAPEHGVQEGFYDFVIQEFTSKSTLVTGKTTLWDYRWKPYQEVGGAGTSTAGPLGDNTYENYDFADSASAYAKTDDGDTNIPTLKNALQAVREQIVDASTVQVSGQSNAIVLESGFTFKLTEYPQNDLNMKYLLTHVEHSAQQIPPFRSKHGMQPQPYGNRFAAIPSSIAYKTERKTPKPRVNGMHTGEVVVPAGEESHMDKYGRVCVQFWWDRQRKPNTPDNTWLRVAQQWAGKGWGTYFWPRGGDEILIDFIEGDPDQPIAVGSVYNGVNMPKYDPAGQYTRSGILTRSSKGGDASTANELRFEDLKGKEQIFINAQKDYDIHTEHDAHTLIGNEHHVTVGANQYKVIDGESHLEVKKKVFEQLDDDCNLMIKGKQIEEVKGDKQQTIGGNHMEKVASDANLNVGQNLNEKVGMNYSLNAGINHYSKAGMVYAVESGQEVHIKGGMTVVIEAGLSLCLAGPGGFITIDPSGVSIQGMLVKINSGGAQMQGSPAQPTDPAAPSSPTAPKPPTWPGDDTSNDTGGT
jgi:type VI secretion system secreted protein VgrG